MATIIFDVAKAANSDTYETCVTVVDNNFTDTIMKSINYTNATPRHLVFNNVCGSTFTIPAKTLLSDGGFTVSVNETVIAANSVTNVPLVYNGQYTGSENLLTGSFDLNDGKTVVSYSITVSEGNRPPVTQDNTLRLGNRVNKVITKDDLIYSGPENDPITHVKFTGDVSRLFTDSDMFRPYVSGTELPIEFTLYYKAPNVDAETTYNVNYFVKAGNDWSN